MLTRFTFFSALLRDTSSDLRSDALKRIRDPVTLGGAFGVHAVRRALLVYSNALTDDIFYPCVRLVSRVRHPHLLLRVMYSTHSQPYRGETTDKKERMTWFMQDIITIIWHALKKLPQLSVEGLSVPSERRAEQAIATYLDMSRL